jgi:predicted Zn-ribbon and HTH transcriptional regulator
VILPKRCDKCGDMFDIDTSKDFCPKCRGLVEPSKIDINKFGEIQ